MPNYLSILDNNIEYYWIVNTNLNGGMDFKLNNSKLSYYYKPNLNLNEGFWIIADDTMQEIDTVQCTVGLTDYHDMIITDDNTYILQAYEIKSLIYLILVVRNWQLSLVYCAFKNLI